jgi:formylglycine-generating enzyme
MARRLRRLALLICGTIFGAPNPDTVLFPAGEFLRGRTFEWSDYEVKWYPNPAKDDTPVKKISLDAFQLDVAEVTNERFAAYAKATGRAKPYYWRNGEIPEGKAQHPVVNVTWEEANAFCAWEGKRLPTEAEWERACRGPVGDNRMFPWGDRDPTSKDAHYGALDGPIGVCSKQKSDTGLCDIIGNVWEWTADWYERKYYEVAPDKNPKGPEKGIYRVLRGGSWFDQPKLFMTCSYRSWAREAERSPTIGFRCAKSVRQ